jgi:hypothetical protein
MPADCHGTVRSMPNTYPNWQRHATETYIEVSFVLQIETPVVCMKIQAQKVHM